MPEAVSEEAEEEAEEDGEAGLLPPSFSWSSSSLIRKDMANVYGPLLVLFPLLLPLLLRLLPLPVPLLLLLPVLPSSDIETDEKEEEWEGAFPCPSPTIIIDAESSGGRGIHPFPSSSTTISWCPDWSAVVEGG
jgi:hypothetical protein